MPLVDDAPVPADVAVPLLPDAPRPVADGVALRLRGGSPPWCVLLAVADTLPLGLGVIVCVANEAVAVGDVVPVADPVAVSLWERLCVGV